MNTARLLAGFGDFVDRMHWLLDDTGEPAPVPIAEFDRWLAWIETADLTIDETYVGRVRVSTVFLGTNQRAWETDKPPVLWETMIFGGVFDGYQLRYRSRAHAALGHGDALRIVLAYRAAPRRIRKSVRKWRTACLSTRHTRGDARRVAQFTRRLARDWSELR